MENALNEIGKLRNEMKVGFIELENQIQASSEKTIEMLTSLMRDNSNLIINSMSKMAGNMEKGFLAVEEAMQQDIDRIDGELASIKKRLDDANL
ncbi:MAG: hypothetical protein AAF789_06655 [Bacteroidota bacterium]